MAEDPFHFPQESFFPANQSSYFANLNVIHHQIGLILPHFLITIEAHEKPF